MKAFVIDPWKRTITELETAARLWDMHELIGCDCIDCAWPFKSRREAIFVNDTGALQSPPLACFYVHGYDGPLFGRGLVLGIGPAGASVSTRLSAEQLEQIVIFPNLVLPPSSAA